MGGFWKKGGFTVASAFPCGVVGSSCVEAAERLLAMFLQSQLSRSLESSWVWGAEGRRVVSEWRDGDEGGKG